MPSPTDDLLQPRVKLALGKRGLDCTLWIDGKEVQGVTDVHIQASARDATSVVVTLIPDTVEVEGDGTVWFVREGPLAAKKRG